MSTESTVEPPLPPRYFWRRVSAYIIDLALVMLVFGAMLAAVNSFSSVRILQPSIFTITSCDAANIVTQERIETLFGKEEGATYSQTLCTQHRMLFFYYRWLRLAEVRVDGHTTISRYTEYLVDEKGERIEAIDGSVPLLLAFPFLMAWFLARRGSTPGKAFLDLQVSTDQGVNPTYGTALLREALRELPFLVFVIPAIVGTLTTFGKTPEELVAMLPSESLRFSWGSLLFGVATSAAIFWWMFGSFIRWRGKAWWDRFAGTRVRLRADFRSPPPTWD